MNNLSIIILFTSICGFLSIMPAGITSYAILSGQSVTNAGKTNITGDLGLFPGSSVQGFQANALNGVYQIANSAALNAQNSLINFYNQLASIPCNTSLTGVDLGGLTLVPGVYCFTSSAALTGTLTLDVQNQPSPIWVFQITSSLVTADNSIIQFINGIAPCNVFWNVGSSATLGINSVFQGIFSAYTSISLNSLASGSGKMLAQNGAVTLISNTITNCTELVAGVRVCFGKLSNDPSACSSNGICVFNQTCACSLGYGGNNCQNITCFSKNTTDPNVCSGQGACSGPNNCTCNPQYNGNNCQFTTCFSKTSNDPTVCSGQGKCSSPNNCTCNPQYMGNQCQFTTCFTKNSTDPTVCNSQGNCTSLNNCTCNSQFGGSQCQSIACFSKVPTDPSVCGGQGNCSSSNNCTCNSQYTGNQCQLPICYTKSSADPTVCGGVGVCTSPNNCTCSSSQFGGPLCQTPICSSKLSTDPTVCNGQGSCTAPNTCACNNQYTGNQCQNPICYGKDSTNPLICSGRGTCSSPSNCVCIAPYSGSECQLSCSNDLSLFSILAGTSITSTGASTVTGDVGVSPGISLTGFPPGIITGNQFVTSVVSQNAQASLTQRYLQISKIPCTKTLTGQDLGGLTLFPGVYCFSSTAQITGTLTLNANNDLSAYWIFQVGTALGTAANSKVVLSNGATSCNVFWNVGSSVSLGATSSFSGNIFAYTSISLDTSAVVTGKLLAQNGAVSLISNTVTNCPISCSTSCYGKQSTDTTACSGRGSCSFPGYCICQKGTNGTQCQTNTTSIVNSSTSTSVSFFVIMSILYNMII